MALPGTPGLFCLFSPFISSLFRAPSHDVGGFCFVRCDTRHVGWMFQGKGVRAWLPRGRRAMTRLALQGPPGVFPVSHGRLSAQSVMVCLRCIGGHLVLGLQHCLFSCSVHLGWEEYVKMCCWSSPLRIVRRRRRTVRSRRPACES